MICEVVSLDTTMGNRCPRCGLQTLVIYYEDESDLQLGARCEECGLKGFFMKGKLVQLATA
jgi:DNA-directed RNA polymerase subunit RPC12/RpoP